MTYGLINGRLLLLTLVLPSSQEKGGRGGGEEMMVREEGITFSTSLLLVHQQESVVQHADGEMRPAELQRLGQLGQSQHTMSSPRGEWICSFCLNCHVNPSDCMDCWLYTCSDIRTITADLESVL